MSDLFKFHKLTPTGQIHAQEIALAFDTLLAALTEHGCAVNSREFAVTKTKLEEACFFAKKSMAVQPEFQESK